MNHQAADRADPAWGILRVLLGLAVVVTLAVAAALFLHAWPLGDDICHAADSRDLGLVGCVEKYYVTLGGRWPGWAISCALFSDGEVQRWYRVALVVIPCVNVAAIAFLLVSLLQLQGRGRLTAALAVLFYTLYWAGMPDPGQSVYWLEGAIQYSLSFSLAFVLIGCLARLPERASRGSVLAVAGLTLAGVVIGGFHELLAAILLGVLAIGTAMAFFEGDGRRFAWAAVAVGVGIGFVIGYAAPGNEARALLTESLEPENRLWGALVSGVSMWTQVIDTPGARSRVDIAGPPLGWLLDPKLLAATLLFATSASVASLRPGWLTRGFEARAWLWKAVFPVGGLGLLSAAFLAGGWAQGRSLPPRAFNGLYLFFLMAWFATLFVHTRWDLDERQPAVRLARGAGALLLALGLLVSTNLKLGIRDLSAGWTAAYDRQMDRRFELLAQQRAEGRLDAVLRPIEQWPRSYFLAREVDPDPEHLLNACLADYAGFRSVRLSEPPDPDDSLR